MKHTLIAIACWLICSVAWGQITVPDKVPIGTELVAAVSANVPPSAKFEGGWTISCSDGCPATYRELKEPNEIGIWSTKVGVYDITYRGYWVLLGPEITVTDTSGVEQKFQPYLGSGLVQEEAVFEITGKEDDDGPDPPLPSAWGLIIEETGDSSATWARQRVALRLEFDKLNKRLLILDQSNLPSSMSKIAQEVRDSNLQLPVLVAVSSAGDAVRIVECPKTVDGVKKELGL